MGPDEGAFLVGSGAAEVANVGGEASLGLTVGKGRTDVELSVGSLDEGERIHAEKKLKKMMASKILFILASA